MDIAEHLSRVSLFALMKSGDLKRLAKQAKVQTYSPGSILVKEGDYDGRFFVITYGRVEVIKNFGQPNQRKVGAFGPNNYFGEMALIDDYVRTATVVATDQTEVLTLDKFNIREEITKYPNLAMDIMQVLARRIRHLERDMG